MLNIWDKGTKNNKIVITVLYAIFILQRNML